MPNAPDLIARSRQALERNQPILAALNLREALAAEPDSVDANAEMGRILAAAGQGAEARAVIDRALAAQPDHALALMLKGTLLDLEGKSAAAIPFFERALASDPRLEAAQVNLGQALRAQGRLDDAERSFRAAIQMNPRSAEGYFGLGQVLSLAGKLPEALEAARQCLQLNPALPAAYLVVSALCAATGKPQEALEVLEQALRHFPDAVAVREARRDLFLAGRDFVAAHGEAEQIAAMRGSAGDWMQLGNLALLAGHGNRAVTAFQKAAELAPEAWEPHYNLGDLYDAANLGPQAGQEYMLALARNEGNYAPHNGMGLWLLRQDRVEEAIAQLARAVDLAPGELTPRYNLALAYAKGRQPARALHLLDAILQDPAAGRLGGEAARLKKTLEAMPNPASGSIATTTS